MAKINFEVFRGDTFKKTLRFTDENGNIIDITNWTIYFTVKYLDYIAGDDNDSDALKQIIINVASGASGITTINWDSIDIDPGDYVYDVQIKKPNEIIKTILYGDFKVNADVTRTV